MSSVGRPAGAPSVRASDSDREAVVDELRQHHAEGRLELDELEDRVGTAYRARTMGELVPVLADLPRPLLPPPPPPPLWQRLGPSVVYLVPAVLVVGVGASVVAGAVTGHSHGGYSFAVPFVFIGLFWARRGRSRWGFSSHRRHGRGGPPDSGLI
ncbi:MAG: DUF1707 SHOCT-like domain-containing protein [Candidatus Dormibacteria bacterium]